MTVHYVYRCYDSEGRFIYVGCTGNLRRRLRDHRRHSWWAPQVAKVKATVHPGQLAGETEERRILRGEAPRWNLQGVWSSRDEWNEERYRDFVYSTLRAGWADLTSERVTEAYAAYSSRFGKSLRDDRIDGKPWPIPLSEIPNPRMRRRIQIVRENRAAA